MAILLHESAMESRPSLRGWIEDGVMLPQYFDGLLENGFDDLKKVARMSEADVASIGITNPEHQKRFVRHVELLLCAIYNDPICS